MSVDPYTDIDEQYLRDAYAARNGPPEDPWGKMTAIFVTLLCGLIFLLAIWWRTWGLG